MKKLLFLGSLGLLLIGCQAEEATELPQDNSGTANSQVGFIELCHWDAVTQTFELITVPQQAVQPHLNHGDALVDADGDGYSAIGSCTGSMDDCDDQDPNVNPEQGCETVFVIAYSNLNGEAGYQEGSADVLISKLVDFNNDGVVSVGDKVITNKYPKNFNGTDYGDFSVTESVISDTGVISNNMITVFKSSSRYIWEDSFCVESYYEIDINTSDVTTFEDRCDELDDRILINYYSPSIPGFNGDAIKLDVTDDSWLEVEISL